MANPVKSPIAPVSMPKSPVAPPAPPAPEAPKKEAKKRIEWTYFFDTADLAKAEAEKRDGGPRRPFTLTANGKTFHVVAHNPEHAKSLIADKLGFTCDEIGKEAKVKKQPSVDAIASMFSSMKPEDRETLEKALAALRK